MIQYIINDQPYTCPTCGWRTMLLGSFFHTNGKYEVEECPNDGCTESILMFCEDEEFNELMDES
jgi:hypothetical protein